MSNLLLSSSLSVVFVASAVGLVLGTYLAARRVLGASRDGDRTHDVAGTVASRIMALHGLILALVYAQELDGYKDVRSGLVDEAVAISDVFNDVRRYGGPVVGPVQQGLARYVRTVVDDEWPRLAHGENLSPAAWAEWEGVYDRLLDLAPATDRETYLSGRMRDRITAVARLRQLREATASSRSGGLFWAPALAGLVLLTVPLYVFRPNRAHVVLLALFGAYSGVILFLIYGLANPFSAPGKLEPEPFERLLAGDLGAVLTAATTSKDR